MAITTIPWNDGSGDNIYVSAPSQTGTENVTVSSDENKGNSDRTQNVTFTATANGQTVTKILTVIQEKTAEQYIVFADPVVEQICATKWGDGVGLKPSQAALVTNSQLGTTFRDNTQITSFDELQYFTGLTQLSSAFYGCTALQSVILPSGLTTIASGVFRECSSLASIDIPSSVTSITSAAFYNCSSLLTVVVRRTTPPTLAYANTFQGGPAARKYYVPYSSDHSVIDLYKATSRWSGYANKIYELNEDGTIPT